MSLANLLRRFGIALAATLVASGAMAQAFPSKTVSLVASFPAGGTTDFFARVIQQEYGKQLGQTVVVENIPGASGSLGVRKVLMAPADGHTQLIGSPLDTIFAPLTMSSVTYKPEDLRIAGLVASSVIVMLIRNDIPAKNLEEFLAWAKDRTVTYSSTGVGSPFHLIAAKFGKMTGIKTLHIPYKGGGEALTAVMGGQVDMAFWTISGAVLGTVKSGGYRALGIAQPQADPLLPDVQPLSHSKLLPDFNYAFWVAVMVPKSTPEPAVARIHDALNHVLADPVIRKRLVESPATIYPPMSLAELDDFYRRQADVYQGLAKEGNMKAQ